MNAPTAVTPRADALTDQRILGLAQKAGFEAIGRHSDGSTFTTLSGSTALKLVRLVEAELKKGLAS